MSSSSEECSRVASKGPGSTATTLCERIGAEIEGVVTSAKRVLPLEFVKMSNDSSSSDETIIGSVLGLEKMSTPSSPTVLSSETSASDSSLTRSITTGNSLLG